MKALIRNSGIFFLLFHFLVWLPTPINSLHATSLEPSNGNGVKEESAENAKAYSLDGFERVTHRIQRGDTLGNLLRPYDLSGADQENWVRSVRKQYSPRRLRPGQEIYFYFSSNGHTSNGHAQPGENGTPTVESTLSPNGELLSEPWVTVGSAMPAGKEAATAGSLRSSMAPPSGPAMPISTGTFAGYEEERR